MSFAAKSCPSQVAIPPMCLGQRLTFFQLPIRSKSAAYPSNRRRDAGISSESASETYKNVKVSL